MPKYTGLSDHELTPLLKKGDDDAFAEIYERYWAVLYRHALRMLGEEEAASDTVQDVFLSLWNKASEITVSASLSAFLYAATRNRVLDHWSRERVREKYITSFQVFTDQEESHTDFRVREKMLSQLIEQEIAALPENMRKAFELSRNSNLSYKEIAEELGVSEHVVRNNISRALKILRVKLGDLTVILLLLG